MDKCEEIVFSEKEFEIPMEIKNIIMGEK